MADRLRLLARGLAGAFLAGEWEPASMTRRGQRAVGERRVWVRELALTVWHAYPSAPADRPHELAELIAECDGLWGHRQLRVVRWYTAPTAMAAPRWPVARLDTVGDLQDLLGLSTGDLLWFADPKGLEQSAPDEKLRHYRYRRTPKRSGGFRLIEEPKPLLKHFQRVLLREIIEQVPVHPAAFGFRKGGSAVSFASGHVRRRVVVHIDLEDFFGSVPPGRVFGIFRQCGYPEPVAHLLTGLVTNSGHLPQGAPTSPALANLSAFRLDRRLAGLAAKSGATYSRYADDLAFSFSQHRNRSEMADFIAVVTRIVSDERFRVNTKKTSVRTSSQRQRLAGVIVNDRPNVDRREYDRLRALLHNAARDGAASQNRAAHPQFRAHVLGRIGWVGQVNPSRRDRLMTAFHAVDWD